MSDYVEKEDHDGGDDDNGPAPVSNFSLLLFLIFHNFNSCLFLSLVMCLGRRIDCDFRSSCKVRNCGI